MDDRLTTSIGFCAVDVLRAREEDEDVDDLEDDDLDDDDEDLEDDDDEDWEDEDDDEE